MAGSLARASYRCKWRRPPTDAPRAPRTLDAVVRGAACAILRPELGASSSSAGPPIDAPSSAIARGHKFARPKLRLLRCPTGARKLLGPPAQASYQIGLISPTIVAASRVRFRAPRIHIDVASRLPKLAPILMQTRTRLATFAPESARNLCNQCARSKNRDATTKTLAIIEPKIHEHFWSLEASRTCRNSRRFSTILEDSRGFSAILQGFPRLRGFERVGGDF